MGGKSSGLIIYTLMEKIFSIDQMRLVLTTLLSTLAAYFSPTKGFLLALVIMFGFNIWAGMRADGVTIVRCKNYSHSKFKNALFELFLYLAIIELVFMVMASVGDKPEALIVIKTLTYVFMYVYTQNSFKNLIIAYPTNKSFRIIYHVIRLEFRRAMPSYVQQIIDRVEAGKSPDDIQPEPTQQTEKEA